MCEIQEEILKIISPFSNGYSKCQLKNFPVFLQTLEMFTWYLQHVHIEAGIIHCFTPRHVEAQDRRGDM